MIATMGYENQNTGILDDIWIKELKMHKTGFHNYLYTPGIRRQSRRSRYGLKGRYQSVIDGNPQLSRNTRRRLLKRFLSETFYLLDCCNASAACVYIGRID